jgi:hypothetical protein
MRHLVVVLGFGLLQAQTPSPDLLIEQQHGRKAGTLKQIGLGLSQEPELGFSSWSFAHWRLRAVFEKMDRKNDAIAEYHRRPDGPEFGGQGAAERLKG